MANIEEIVLQTINSCNEKSFVEQNIKTLEKANQEFKGMIKKGVIKSRGYNLMSIEDAHLKRFSFFKK